MKNGIALVCFFFFMNAVSAQTNQAAPDSITKEEFLKFNNLNEALKLPSVYEVNSATIMFSSKGEIFKAMIFNSTLNEYISHFVARASTGDKIIFDDIMVKKGEKTFKLISKVYIIR